MMVLDLEHCKFQRDSMHLKTLSADNTIQSVSTYQCQAAMQRAKAQYDCATTFIDCASGISMSKECHRPLNFALG